MPTSLSHPRNAAYHTSYPAPLGQVDADAGRVGEIQPLDQHKGANLRPNSALRSSCERAVDLASIAQKKGTFGVGAVLLDGGKPIADAANSVIQKDGASGHDTLHHTLHAEMQLLNWYAAQQRSKKSVPPLSQLTVVTSLAPCLMCLSRMMKQGVKSVRYLADDVDAGITDRNAREHLPKNLANETIEVVQPIVNTPLAQRSLSIFSKTCHQIRECANGAVASRCDTSNGASSAAFPALHERGKLTQAGRALVSKYFSDWDNLQDSYAGKPIPRAAIVTPGDSRSLSIAEPHDWPEAVEYNLIRDLIDQWDASPDHGAPLKDCIVVTNLSFDLTKGSNEAQWNILHSIGALSSAAEGAPLLILCSQPLPEKPQQQIAALPKMCHNLVFLSFPKV